MALESKITGLQMVVEAVEAERGSWVNPPVPTPYALTIYLDYPEHCSTRPGAAGLLLPALRVCERL